MEQLANPARSQSMSNPSPPPSLVKALRHVLRPIVRIMLAKGIGYGYLSDLLKEIFVDVAEKDFALENKAQTDSRISVLTGVHRKDVRRLRAQIYEPNAAPPGVSLGMRVVSAWGTPPYVDEAGLPAPLPRLPSKGGELSFDGMVASVSKDIRARALLDEWLRLGVVRLDDEDRVILDSSAFIPSSSFDDKAFYFGHNLHDHAAAAVSNLMGEHSPFVERSVHHGTLSAETVAALGKEAERGGMRLLHALNRKAVDAKENPPTPTETPQRFTFGVYFYAAPDDEEGRD